MRKTKAPNLRCLCSMLVVPGVAVWIEGWGNGKEIQGHTGKMWCFQGFGKALGDAGNFWRGVFFFERHQAYIKRCKPCNLNPCKRHLTWCVVVPPSSEPLFAKASSWCHRHYLTSQQMNCSQPAAPFMCMYIRIYTSHQRFQLSVHPNMSIGIGMLISSTRFDQIMLYKHQGNKFDPPNLR